MCRSRRESEKEREREKRWMAGEVSLMCAEALTLPDRDLTKLYPSSQNTDKPYCGSYINESSERVKYLD